MTTKDYEKDYLKWSVDLLRLLFNPLLSFVLRWSCFFLCICNGIWSTIKISTYLLHIELPPICNLVHLTLTMMRFVRIMMMMIRGIIFMIVVIIISFNATFAIDHDFQFVNVTDWWGFAWIGSRDMAQAQMVILIWQSCNLAHCISQLPKNRICATRKLWFLPPTNWFVPPPWQVKWKTIEFCGQHSD